MHVYRSATRPYFKRVRAELYGTLPKVHLTEIIVKIDSAVRFSWTLLGRPPRTDLELVYLYTRSRDEHGARATREGAEP
jgi:hypothetical protein